MVTPLYTRAYEGSIGGGRPRVQDPPEGYGHEANRERLQAMRADSLSTFSK